MYPPSEIATLWMADGESFISTPLYRDMILILS